MANTEKANTKEANIEKYKSRKKLTEFVTSCHHDSQLKIEDDESRPPPGVDPLIYFVNKRGCKHTCRPVGYVMYSNTNGGILSIGGI